MTPTSVDDRVAWLETQLAESQDNTSVVLRTTKVLDHASTRVEAASGAITTVLECFHWGVGAYWNLEDDDTLRVAAQCGSRTEAVHWPVGESARSSVVDRARQSRALVFDEVRVEDGPRMAAAARAGWVSVLAFPIVTRGKVAGVMEFFAPKLDLPLGAERLESLESVQQLLSIGFVRLENLEQSSRLHAAINGASNALMLCDREFRVV
ncbi:MAG: GAF domain-containing protein, partial [Planctomycetes bacterium]|nr:GAF domain-containing protein [Planctomycetota bacterium]